MRTRALIGVAGLALAAAMAPAANADFVRESEKQRFLPGEAIVIYEQGTGAGERRDARGAAGVRFEESLELARTQVVTFDGPVRAAVARLEDEPGVAHAQPNYRYEALAAAPNDTHFGQLWGMGATPGVNVLPAWDRSRGAGQIIAIVDSGVDLTHPDLAENLWPGPGGIHGRDFVDDDSVPDDFNLHGTHVAGTAAAVANNATGVAGVAPQARIMAVRVLDGDGGGSSSDIAAGIVFAADNGARVINLSLGGPAGGGGDTLMRNAVTHAGTRGAVVVAAAGNENNDNDASPTTPCTLPNANLICVASVTKTGARSGFSNYGRRTVDVGAPGGDGSGVANRDILSAKPAWAAPLFSENFNTVPFSQWTATGTWGPAGAGLGGGDSVTDSPSGDYAPNTNSMFQKTAAIDLTAQRGCMIDYFLLLDGIEEDVDPSGDLVDAVGVGVFTATGAVGDEFAGSTPPSTFRRMEQSIEAVDGRSDVKPTFTFRSNATVQGGGAHVDSFNLLCRGGAYDDAIGADEALAGHSYTAISGTSMSAPHVAAVAALVRAVDVGVPPAQVVQALKNGAKPASGMANVTVTGGVVDAVGAISAALALPNVAPPPPIPPQPPSKARIVRAKVNGRGVLTIVVRGDAGNRGVATLTANIARAARVTRIARKGFRIGPAGRATVRLKLKRAAVRQLRRKRKLRVRAKIVLTNTAGLRSTRASPIRLTFRRR